MAKWRKVKLADVCKFVRGPFGGSLKKDIFVSQGYAVFEQQHAIYGDFNKFRYFVTKDKFNEMQRFKLSPGDLIMSCSGTLGKVALVPEGIPNGIINQALLKLTPTDEVEGSYIKSWFESDLFTQSLRQNSGGAAIQNVAEVRLLKEIEIPLPPLAEQRKIAEILRTWDEAIETAEAELKAKQERKLWLTMRLISGESRLPGCSGKWEKFRLADLFERVMQKNEESCERCLTISAEKGLVDQREYFDRRISSTDTSGYFLMKRGDFAYNRSYSNGYPYGVVKRLNAYDVGTVTTLYLVFTPRNRTFDPLYMEHVFDSGILNKGLRTIVQEGARAHGLLNVKAEDFFSLVVFIPDLNEQSKISKLLSDAQTQITACATHLELLRNQKRGLMQKLLTGEVRVAA